MYFLDGVMVMQKKVFKSVFLLVIFCSFLANPLLIEGVEYTYSFTEIGTIEPGISVINLQCIDNEVAFILDMSNQLAVFNITEPANVVELDSVYLNHPHDVELDLDRNLVYATASNGVNIFDFSNTSELQLLSTYKNYTYSTFIQLQGELLFVGAEEYGLQIVNVTDPSNPYLLGNWTDPIGDVGPSYILNDYAFVGTRTVIPDVSITYLNLKVLDISDPTNITYVSTVNTGGTYNGGAPRAYINDLVYFNDHAFGLKILNFSNPYDVSLVGHFLDGGFYNDLELVDGEIAFLADDYFGLKVVSCTDIVNPSVIGTHELDWRTLRVVVKDTRVYIATLSGGIRILSFEIATQKISTFPFWIFSGLIIASAVLYYTMNRKRKTNLK